MGPNARVTNIPGLNIPEHDYVASTYVETTNNLDTVVYRKGGLAGRVVATLTFTYVGGTPAANDARIASVARS